LGGVRLPSLLYGQASGVSWSLKMTPCKSTNLLTCKAPNSLIDYKFARKSLHRWS
jgi:hypothetical protein